MSHLLYKQTACIRNFDYSKRPIVDEGDEWKSGTGDPLFGEDIGFSLWGDDKTKRTVLVIQSTEAYTVLLGGFTRIMDLFQQEVTANSRPWRIFSISTIRKSSIMICELFFSRDGSEYKLLDYAPATLAEMRGVIGHGVSEERSTDPEPAG
jgi:hypothetical protein